MFLYIQKILTEVHMGTKVVFFNGFILAAHTLNISGGQIVLRSFKNLLDRPILNQLPKVFTHPKKAHPHEYRDFWTQSVWPSQTQEVPLY